MEAAELSYWQVNLPSDRDGLMAVLDELQRSWTDAQTALIPAIKLGNGYLLQQVVATLATQLQIVEQRLIHWDAAIGGP